MEFKVSKTFLFLFFVFISLLSCEDNCDDEVAEIREHYNSLIMQSDDIEQIELLRREMDAKIERACD